MAHTTRTLFLIYATLLSIIGLFVSDMYLPALGNIRSHFSTEASLVGISLSIYMVGFTMAQLIYGALSDQIGRKKLEKTARTHRYLRFRNTSSTLQPPRSQNDSSGAGKGYSLRRMGNASELSDLAGLTSTNKSAGPAKWKSANKIFSVSYLSEELFPIYAIDKVNGFKPQKGLKPVLEVFAGEKDSWGIAYWFAGANGYLGGKRPLDLLASNPDLVLQAAIDELKGVTHG